MEHIPNWTNLPEYRCYFDGEPVFKGGRGWVPSDSEGCSSDIQYGDSHIVYLGTPRPIHGTDRHPESFSFSGDDDIAPLEHMCDLGYQQKAGKVGRAMWEGDVCQNHDTSKSSGGPDILSQKQLSDDLGYQHTAG